ncbi:MAG TPA: hypothetical protein VGO57_06820 [Verrucomicrobiae bacterium]|jgi:hypothetical protein
MIARRKFLRDFSAAAAVTVILTPAFSFGASTIINSKYRPNVELSYAALASQLNSNFRVQLSPGQLIQLKLIKAERYASTCVLPGHQPPTDAGHEKFSLIFSGSKSVLLAPAIHSFEHDQLGRFEMYIGQVGARDTTEYVRYEAVFNRPATTPQTFLT